MDHIGFRQRVKLLVGRRAVAKLQPELGEYGGDEHNHRWHVRSRHEAHFDRHQINVACSRCRAAS